MKDYRDILAEQNLTAAVNNYLFSGDGMGGEHVMQRKATNFVDLGKAKSLKKMPKEVQDFINGLKTITWMDLYGVAPVKGWELWRPHNGIFLLKKTPVWFKVKHGATIILMDTEGYDYPRFAARIKK